MFSCVARWSSLSSISADEIGGREHVQYRRCFVAGELTESPSPM